MLPLHLDDIIVMAKTFEEMMARLDEVFSRLHLKLKAQKCELFQKQVSSYLYLFVHLFTWLSSLHAFCITPILLPEIEVRYQSLSP